MGNWLKTRACAKKVDEKSNEITAIPEVLNMLDIRGCIVTIDAMGCQQKIAQQIVDQGGDYIFGLKGNQGTTLTVVEEHFSLNPENKFKNFEDIDKRHGRIETRRYFAADTQTIFDLKDWPGLKSAVKVVSTRNIDDVPTTEERFYLSSLEPNAVEKIGRSTRAHWDIENSLHYVLDVTFNQDNSRIRNGNSAENFGILRHISMNVLRGAQNAKKSSPSSRLKRMKVGWDNDYLEQVMMSTGLQKS